MWGLEWVCFVLVFCSPASIKKEEMAEGLWVFFPYMLDSPLGKVKGNTLLLQNENLEGTSPFTFVFYGTTVLNKAYCYFAIS